MRPAGKARRAELSLGVFGGSEQAPLAGMRARAECNQTSGERY